MKIWLGRASLIFVFLPFVDAHGCLSFISLDGVVNRAYTGNSCGGSSPDPKAAIRWVSTQDPIMGATNLDINCGSSAKAAPQVLKAKPSSRLQLNWRQTDNTNWPHNIGPMLTYMASCGSATCDKFNSMKAKWFKISEVGRNANGEWEQNTLYQGGHATATIPANLAPGNYLLRHEIIALHLGTQFQGAQFYAGCVQLKVQGNGTGVPSPNDLVSLPGAYSDRDPGIYDPNVFDANVKYPMPGPPVAKLVATATSLPSAAAPKATAKTTSKAAASSPKSTSSRSQCNANRRRRTIAP